MPTSGPNELSWLEWELGELRRRMREAQARVLELAKEEEQLLNRQESFRQQGSSPESESFLR